MWKMCSLQAVCGKWVCGGCVHSTQFVVSGYVEDVFIAGSLWQVGMCS